MKMCVMCKEAGISNQENQHPDDELGAYIIGEEWICDDCRDAFHEHYYWEVTTDSGLA